MAKKTSIYFKKTEINGILCAVPIYDKDRDALSKIKGDFEADLWQYRNLQHHRKLFAIAGICVDNGILDHIDGIDPLAIEMMRREHNDDTYTLIYIAKWLFLPKDRVLQPDGTRREIVSSIDFKSMDQTIFEDFYNKCLVWFADCLGCTVEELEQNYLS